MEEVQWQIKSQKNKQNNQHNIVEVVTIIIKIVEDNLKILKRKH